MQADKTEAKARFEELKRAGNESWAALSAALETSRKKFEEASQSAWEAVKNSVPTMSDEFP